MDAARSSPFGSLRDLLRVGIIYKALGEIGLTGAVSPSTTEGRPAPVPAGLLELVQKVRANVPFALEAFRVKASALIGAAEQLIVNDGETVLSRRAANSSQAEVLAGEVDPERAENKQFSIRVDRLATAQLHVSFAFTGSATNEFPSGRATFSILFDSIEYVIPVDVRAADTNKQVLDQIAGAINNDSMASSRVKATVQQVDGDLYQLRIEGRNTGEGAAFSVVEGDGGLVTKAGLDRVAVEAQDAVIYVNGERKTFSTNRAQLAPGVVLDLKRAAAGRVELTVDGDIPGSTEALSAFVRSFNDVLDTLKMGPVLNGEVSGALRRIVQDRSAALREIGLEVSDQGRLRLDQERFAKALAANTERVQELIGGERGVATQVARLMREVLGRPAGVASTAALPRPLQSFVGNQFDVLLLREVDTEGARINLEA